MSGYPLNVVAERNGVTVKTLQNLSYLDKSKGIDIRFFKVGGETLAVSEEYKDIYKDEIAELYYKALELVELGKSENRDWALCKELAKISSKRNKKSVLKETHRFYQHLYRFSFKHHTVAKEFRELLNKFINSHFDFGE